MLQLNLCTLLKSLLVELNYCDCSMISCRNVCSIRLMSPVFSIASIPCLIPSDSIHHSPFLPPSQHQQQPHHCCRWGLFCLLCSLKYLHMQKTPPTTLCSNPTSSLSYSFPPPPSPVTISSPLSLDSDCVYMSLFIAVFSAAARLQSFFFCPKLVSSLYVVWGKSSFWISCSDLVP